LTGVSLAAHACRRVRDSGPQAALPWTERARNIRAAFVCDADLSGLRVAVVDDVMTTGANLERDRAQSAQGRRHRGSRLDGGKNLETGLSVQEAIRRKP
jgi:hypothetical protein